MIYTITPKASPKNIVLFLVDKFESKGIDCIKAYELAYITLEAMLEIRNYSASKPNMQKAFKILHDRIHKGIIF